MDYVSCTLTLILYIYCVQFARLDWDKNIQSVYLKCMGLILYAKLASEVLNLTFLLNISMKAVLSIHFNRTYRIKVEVDKSERVRNTC